MVELVIPQSSCMNCGKKSDEISGLGRNAFAFFAIGKNKILFFCSLTCITEFPFEEVQ